MLKSISFAALPALGASLDEAEFRGVITQPDGTHYAVVLLGISEKRASHADQIAWAKERGGQLVTRAVINLLIATMGLPDGWYWTADEYSASYAWVCNSNGTQGFDDRSAEGAGVAVRLIPLVA